MKPNSIHLYFHRIMIRLINPKISKCHISSAVVDMNGVLTRKRAMAVFGKYFKFVPNTLKEAILDEMFNMKLLKEIDTYRIKIINHDKSDPRNIDSGVLIKLLESGGT